LDFDAVPFPKADTLVFVLLRAPFGKHVLFNQRNGDHGRAAMTPR
jgi:hypothetical protein